MPAFDAVSGSPGGEITFELYTAYGDALPASSDNVGSIRPARKDEVEAIFVLSGTKPTHVLYCDKDLTITQPASRTVDTNVLTWSATDTAASEIRVSATTTRWKVLYLDRIDRGKLREQQVVYLIRHSGV